MKSNKKFQEKCCLLMASAVVKAGIGGVPVRVFNPGHEPVTLYKNTLVTECVEVDVMKEGEKRSRQMKEVPGRDLPEHLKSMYLESGEEFSEAERQQLKELCEHEEVFSAHDLDMGRTGMIKHRIDTKDAHPVKQRLRRVPIHMKGVVKNEIQKLMDRGLIESSINP